MELIKDTRVVSISVVNIGYKYPRSTGILSAGIFKRLLQIYLNILRKFKMLCLTWERAELPCEFKDEFRLKTLKIFQKNSFLLTR